MKQLKIIIFLLIFTGLSSPVFADSFLENLSGKILLQVEENGEAWYFNPEDLYRYYLGRPLDAFNLMREWGIGISNKDLKKIQIGILENDNEDSDQDGLSDALELALKTDPFLKDSDRDGFSDKEEIENSFNPLGEGHEILDYNFSKKNSGKIFLQVENKGEAWYLNPEDQKRYYLGRPKDAFAVMRFLGLGISNVDIEKIPAKTSAINISSFEKILFDLVNKERTKINLNALIFNEELAQVAREHSFNLARENENFSGKEKACDFPMIHHEGLDFGLYSSDRLRNRNINYFSMSGENIALMSSSVYNVTYSFDDPIRFELEACAGKREELDQKFKAELENLETEEEKKNFIYLEIEKRKEIYDNTGDINFNNAYWKNEKILAWETVDGWMNSPGHKANIVNENFNQSGIGVVFVNGYAISTQVFIKKIDCGYKGAECCHEKETIYCYAPNSCEEGVCL